MLIDFNFYNSLIGKKCVYNGQKYTIGAVYLYVNKFGIVSCRFRFFGCFNFVNFDKVVIIDEK